MKNIFIILLMAIATVSLAQETYRVSIDLNKTEEDKIPVEIRVPDISSETVEYHMAKIVPGTYSISDFGRFVVDFNVFDKEGNKMEVESKDVNRWAIKNATQLDRISYWVHDSHDNFENYTTNIIFEPGGTNIDAENNVFVMNTFGFIGYIDGMKSNPYEVTIRHNESIYGATSLKRKNANATSDTFVADNFNFLADAPIMYCAPDTVSKNIAGAKVLVSVYAPKGKLSADDVMNNIDELMEAQADYLGGKLPVDRYAYLIYLLDKPPLSGSWGALEHSYSSLYSLPEMKPARISQIVKDVAAHEFFHIVTPLNIHSKEIHDFNYIEPDMSQHLWLYEGVTEYSSHHVQVKHGLYDIDTFLEQIKNKIEEKNRYAVNVPFTYLSEHILEDEYAPKYGDVYSKGALISMCLDLYIIRYSNGERNLQWLMRELAGTYGPDKAFNDEDLFSEIESLTSPEVGEFLRTHVGGTMPLPIRETLGWAGIDYVADAEQEEKITAGKFNIGLNDANEIVFTGVESMNKFGRRLGIEKDDVLIVWGDTEVTQQNLNDVFSEFYETTNEGDKVEVIVRREIRGKQKKIKLKARAMLFTIKQTHVFTVSENPTSDQLKIRKIWINQ